MYGTPPIPSILLRGSMDPAWEDFYKKSQDSANDSDDQRTLDTSSSPTNDSDDQGTFHGRPKASSSSAASSSDVGTSDRVRFDRRRGSVTSDDFHQDSLMTESQETFLRGRPPWYDAVGNVRKPFIIGVAGGTGSGKTSVCRKIIEGLNVNWVSVVSMDSFYLGLSPDEHDNAADYDFDHPSALDFPALLDTIKQLRSGQSVEIPIYDFASHSRLDRTRTLYGADVIIIEGILLFSDAEICDNCDMKVFVDTDADIRLARRLRRDVAERGRTVHSILEQYQRFVKPAHDEFVQPTKSFADVIIPRGAKNEIAIQLIIDHIKSILAKRGYIENLQQSPNISGVGGQPLPNAVKIMPSTNQSKALHTIIRNVHTKRDDFCFYSNRLCRMLIEFSLTFLPFTKHTVQTPTQAPFDGLKTSARLCAVSVMRAGEAMEEAVREVCLKIRIGKLLIQSFKKQPRLFYLSLPKDIHQRHVLLLDPTLATGSAILMAIRVLLDHGVREENILFCTLIASKPGLHRVLYSYPKIKVITSEVEDIDNNYFCSPGCGNFGARYFGDKI